jgi:hypothetical protein
MSSVGPPDVVLLSDATTDYPVPDEDVITARVFLSLLSAGAGLMSILLLVVIVSPQIHRHPTWLNFCVTCE